MTQRTDVYTIIDEERAYQTKRWNRETTKSGGYHSITEWLVYMQDYINEALHTASRESDSKADELALHNIRKVAAMAVACMEEHGAPSRWHTK